MSKYQNKLYKLLFREDIEFGSDDPNELAAFVQQKYPQGLPPLGSVVIEVGPHAKRFGGMQRDKWLRNPAARSNLETL
ncbi:hypothetical protein [Burkholderia cenocepacia]|uniref:hypothetical protein n=1 Tax=Burkholderia cenocepacia TaxID=95486 RepID=UPI002AB69A41|nr:hypothetical protein [Burkholderia cenocepacia]